jgi:hypothetical protein
VISAAAGNGDYLGPLRELPNLPALLRLPSINNFNALLTAESYSQVVGNSRQVRKKKNREPDSKKNFTGT